MINDYKLLEYLQSEKFQKRYEVSDKTNNEILVRLPHKIMSVDQNLCKLDQFAEFPSFYSEEFNNFLEEKKKEGRNFVLIDNDEVKNKYVIYHNHDLNQTFKLDFENVGFILKIGSNPLEPMVRDFIKGIRAKCSKYHVICDHNTYHVTTETLSDVFNVNPKFLTGKPVLYISEELTTFMYFKIKAKMF